MKSCGHNSEGCEGHAALQAEIDTLKQQLAEAVEFINSIDWITSYDDGGTDTCKADRDKARAFLQKIGGVK